MHTVYDAIIVGAGPAGSTAAILLAREGWRVALIEKQLFPRRKVCGECIAASNLPLLDGLGIGDAFAALAGPELREVALMHGNTQTHALLPPALHGRHRWGRALGRETLDCLLLEQARAAGAQVLQPWSALAIQGAPGNWRCVIRALDSTAKKTLLAPLLIAANGSWEPLASERAVTPAVHRVTDLLAFKANFSAAVLARGLLPVLSFSGGYGGMVGADAGVTTVACCIRRDRLEALRLSLPGLSAGTAVETLLKRECAGVREALKTATRDGPWLAAGPLNPGIRVNTPDGILRIGNAAGEAHPIIGEGISMALQSAWLLCSYLLDRRDGASASARTNAGGATTGNELISQAAWQRVVQQRYAAQWRQQFGPRLRLAATFAHVAMRPASAALMASTVRRWPGLLTLGATWGGKARSVVEFGDLKTEATA